MAINPYMNRHKQTKACPLPDAVRFVGNKTDDTAALASDVANTNNESGKPSEKPE